MPIYCSVDPYFLIDFASEPLWHPNDIELSHPTYQIPRGVYRWVDPQGVYLGWMAVRITRAFEKLAAGESVDLDRLSEAVTLYHDAQEATGTTPCRLEDIPAGYRRPGVPDVAWAAGAFERQAHSPGAGPVRRR
jgi:hypothetical protein